MDINQQLEYINLSDDVLTEKDVLDTIENDSTKVVSSKGIYEALLNISSDISTDYTLKTDTFELIQNLSDQLSNYQKNGNYISSSVLSDLATKNFVEENFLRTHQSLSDYYKKNETSSNYELLNKFNDIEDDLKKRLLIDSFNKSIQNYVLLSTIYDFGFITSHQSLSDYYKKNETSSAIEILNKFSNYYDINNSYSKYQINSILNNYAFLSDVYTKKHIDNILKIYALNDNVSSKIELATEFAKYQLSGNYALNNEVSSKEELSDEFAKYQLSGDYALSSEVSSKEQLSVEFAKYQLSGNYAISSEVSSKEELSDEFAKYQLSGNYALSNEVSSIVELSDEFAKYQLSGDYALNSEVSSKEELSAEFAKYQISSNYALSNEVSSKEELNNEFAKYQLSGNYAVSSEVSSKEELSNKFSEYSKIQLYGKLSGELSDELKKYMLLSDSYSQDQINNIIKSLSDCVSSNYVDNVKIQEYALCADVMSIAELCNKFSSIDDEFNNVVHLDRSCEISANIGVLSNLDANNLYANNFTIDFSNQYNLNPQIILSSLADYVSCSTPIGKIYNDINNLIIDSDLSVKLLNLKQTNPDRLEELSTVLNSINDITKSKKLTDDSILFDYVSCINNNINLLSNTISSINLQQSLSSLGKKIHVVNNKTLYNNCIITDIATELNKSYAKNQTSSAIELKNAFNNTQPKGNYITDESAQAYATKKWTKQNFVSLNSLVSLTDLNVKNLTAENIKVDFSKLIDCKQSTCLSGYLLFIQPSSDPIVIANRVNEIITYCDLNIKPIFKPCNMYDEIFDATTKICDYAKIDRPIYRYDEDKYFDIINKLNIAITRIYISNGLSLQKILQSYQLTYILIFIYLNNMYKHFENEISALSSDNEQLNDKIKSLIVKDAELDNKISSIKNSLSGFSVSDVSENGTVRNANSILSTLIVCFGGH